MDRFTALAHDGHITRHDARCWLARQMEASQQVWRRNYKVTTALLTSLRSGMFVVVG